MLAVVVVVCTVFEASLLSVMFADVNWLTCTVPEGALGPEKVTGREFARLRLNSTTLCEVPFRKANDCISCAVLSRMPSEVNCWFQVGFAPVWTVASMLP